jgi:hypothetical protein
MPSEPLEWWHVIWTTFLAWPPKDSRGDWQDLSDLYAGLVERHGPVAMSDPLPDRWQGRPEPDNAVQLSSFARELLMPSLQDLTQTDRLAGDTPVRALAVRPRSVQILLACPGDALQQRVGRLKSRSATLLSFDPATGIAGKGTWGKGFWWARLRDEALAGEVEAFLVQGLMRGE